MSKNPALIPGVATLSRSAAFKAKGLFNRKKAAPAKPVVKPTHVVKKIGGDKNGATRSVAVSKVARFYPAEDEKAQKKTRKTQRAATTRASITPGTVLILVAGRFAGKRVVYLKTLDSGLLLVTGPYKINGVPLRRVNQAFVIATSAKVDVSKVAVPASVNDEYFKVGKESKAKATDAALFDAATKKPIDAARAKDQKTVDESILSAIKKTPLLKAYLNASFALSKGQAPHLLKF